MRFANLMSAVALGAAVTFSGMSYSFAGDITAASPSVMLDAQSATSITGTVTGADGKPAKGVAVMIRPAPAKAPPAGGKNKKTAAGEKPERDKPAGENGDKPKPAPENGPPALATAKTDAEGKFHFDKIKPGDYIVVARDQATRTIGRTRVTIADGQEATVDIKLAARPKDGQNPGANGQEGNGQDQPREGGRKGQQGQRPPKN